MLQYKVKIQGLASEVENKIRRAVADMESKILNVVLECERKVQSLTEVLENTPVIRESVISVSSKSDAQNTNVENGAVFGNTDVQDTLHALLVVENVTVSNEEDVKSGITSAVADTEQSGNTSIASGSIKENGESPEQKVKTKACIINVSTSPEETTTSARDNFSKNNNNGCYYTK